MGFPTTTLARISYDENSSSREILETWHAIPATCSLPLNPGSLCPAAKWLLIFHTSARVKPGIRKNLDLTVRKQRLPARIAFLSRPPIEHSGIIARLFATPFGNRPCFFFLLGPAFSVFLQSWHLNHPVFWKPRQALPCWARDLFCFHTGLLLLTYKRWWKIPPPPRFVPWPWA
jgi:hypothetical protein